MQADQKALFRITVAINIIMLLVIIYLGVEEVFKIRKLLKKKLDDYFAWADDDLRVHREWASQAYGILKKRQAEQKEAHLN